MFGASESLDDHQQSHTSANFGASPPARRPAPTVTTPAKTSLRWKPCGDGASHRNPASNRKSVHIVEDLPKSSFDVFGPNATRDPFAPRHYSSEPSSDVEDHGKRHRRGGSGRASSPSSPLSDGESDDDDEDDLPLMTPRDERVPELALGQDEGCVPTADKARRASQDSSADPADLVAGSGYSERRGSLPDLNFPDLQLSSLPDESQTDGRTAPPFSRSTFVDLGMVKGNTPPASGGPTRGLPAVGSSAMTSSQVVSAGLEMGLGVSAATSALVNSLPGGAPFAEPRFSRSSLSGASSDFTTLAMGLRLTDSQLGQDSLNSPSGLATADGRGPLASDAPSPLRLDEAELNRRRTTGAIPHGHRRIESLASRKHLRAGTVDDSTSHPPSAYIPYAARIGGETTECGGSTSGQSSDARASAGRGSTNIDTPSLGTKGMLSPDTRSHGRSSYLGDFDGSATGADAHAGNRGNAMERNAGSAGPVVFGTPANGLMGTGSGGGHFGPQIRQKVMQALDVLIPTIPLDDVEGETVHIAEYGCLNSKSAPLMQPIISTFAARAHARRARPAAAASSHSHLEERADPIAQAFAQGGAPTVVGDRFMDDAPSPINFAVTHEDASRADFRSLTQLLDSNSESYLDTAWQATHRPSLLNSVFPSFVARPFASRIAPPSTMHLGFSLMDMHWIHTPRNESIPLSTTAHAELTTFLTARAHEFRKGGLLVMAFLARSEDDSPAPVRPKSSVALRSDAAAAAAASGASSSATAASTVQTGRERSSSSPGQPTWPSSSGATAAPQHPPKDIWNTLTQTLAPAIQRLCSCGMLKSDVARHMLSLPLHARTPRQTSAALKSVAHLWNVEWSCGLGQASGADASTPPASSDHPRRPSHAPLHDEPLPLRLPHPAVKAYQAGTLSAASMKEHALQFYRNLYEAHFRSVLIHKGRYSKGAAEFALDSLWDVVASRIEDQLPGSIEGFEIEATVVCLRRV